MKFSQIVEKLNITAFDLAADPDIIGITPIELAQPQTLSYIEGAKFAAQVASTTASALVLPLDAELQRQATERGIAWIAHSSPRRVFAEAITLFYQPYRLAAGIHPTSVIDSSAQLGSNVAIGAHVVIETGVIIADNVYIHPNVVIYPGVNIGEGTVLHANCTIHERTQIGANCVIHSGAVIGAEGFGFVPTPEGWLKMQQSGAVVIEDQVEVGCNSTIDRPALGTTRIGRDTKIDNLVHIGHGCQISEGCILAGQVGLSGAVQVGKRVIMAGQVGIVDHVKIGEGAIVSAKAGVHNDVAAGAMVSGIPAVPHKLFLKASAVINRLPEMYQSLRQIQKQLGK
jgi:UDP-3-O-[3-hydroxymyristoyl] glucosamine N-acyltransferase